MCCKPFKPRGQDNLCFSGSFFPLIRVTSFNALVFAFTIVNFPLSYASRFLFTGDACGFYFIIFESVSLSWVVM